MVKPPGFQSGDCRFKSCQGYNKGEIMRYGLLYKNTPCVDVTLGDHKKCPHENGWFVWPRFWIFKRKYLACSDCGELIPKGRWILD